MFESLTANIILFVVAAIAIGFAGSRMAKVTDLIADKTGWGEAIVGAVFLGGSTSLSGIVTSVTAASQGRAELAVSNALGGIAAQTVFLAIADIVYRRANLEHAAASVANLMQGVLLITLLAIPLVATTSQPIAFWGIHPASLFLIASYGFGLRLITKARTDPMWWATNTDESRFDEADDSNLENVSLTSLWMQFSLLGLTIAVAGYAVAQSGGAIATQTGLSETIVGAMLTAIATSLPELVTSIAAVRRGALTLAVGDIIGGNCFDVLFLSFSDIAYRDGSIYHAITQREKFIVSLTLLLIGILLLGLLRRERYGFGNIGFESFLIIVLYIAGFVVLFGGTA